VTIDIADPGFARKDLVPEEDANLEIGTLIGDYIVIVYKKDVRVVFLLSTITLED